LYGRLGGGILARIDDMLFIRGNNVYPSAVEAVIRRFPEVAEFRVRAGRSGELSGLRVEIEPAPAAPRSCPAGAPAEGAEALRRRVAVALEGTFLFRSEVVLVPEGSLPRFELKGRRFLREDPPGGPGSSTGEP
jgi:phenylacetate-CoA ligase